ncbi:putative snare domain protein [Phaeomoniella chlamydospora]|uniref:Putative snare domain protein n=1 Tax=Phaeomoniella chlamydospora TaxID=158046 RepID=A0A0G2DXR9_PHACM|nr:putative snare domain protein [Phaeomoniella chlamydospora]
MSNYGQYNPYGQQNPYAQQENPYAQQQGGHPQQGGYGEQQGNQGYEMANMNGNRPTNPNQILEDCREVDRGVDLVDQKLEQLRQLQAQSLNETDVSSNSPVAREIERIMVDIETTYRGLISRMKAIKSQPESGNPRNAPQVGRVDRRLRDAVQRNMQLRRDYEKRCKEQFERNYRIVRPQASDAEVREAAEDPSNTQVFSQAMLSSDRRGQAQSALQAVRSRHDAIQKVERDIITLAQLFQDLEQAVAIQEPAVAQIEQKGEEVNDNVSKGNQELNVAVDKARAARRKKWWCLLICLLIIIVIIVIVVIVVEVTKK